MPNKVIYKCQLETTESQEFVLPHDFKFLTLQTQMEKPCLWFEVSQNAPVVVVEVRIIGTGHQLPDDVELTYLGSYQLMNGSFVGHVYMVAK